jgi:hypothetical protein
MKYHLPKMKSLNLSLILAVLATSMLIAAPASAAGKKVKISKPDFTRGDAIPSEAKHDWTLGATGARGWMFAENFATTTARQIAVTKVAKGSPADGVLKVGDVILGVGGKAFSYDPRTEFGKALTVAETEAAGGKLSLIRWRAGKTEEVNLKLQVLGSYSGTAPFDCPKSKRIFEQGCAALAKRVGSPGYDKQNPISRSLNALALLASGDSKYLPIVKKEAQWASNFSAESMATWYYGYVITLLAEYKMATGDESVVPGMKRLALEAARGQSAVGSWGHKFARPDGRLNGYGMMNAPGLPLTISLVLAREAGAKDPAIDLAIERSAKLLRFYIGKGCVPYGDHAPWMQSHDDNGKNGMATVLFNLLDDAKGTAYFSRMSLASHSAERDCGHTGNFWNILWAMPGVAQGGPQATGAWMNEFGAWYYDLARQWDGTFTHQGQPQPGNDSTSNWDSTGAYLLAYAMPLKKIWLTGKRGSKFPPFTASEAKQIVRDGAGWSQGDHNSFYDKLIDTELLNRLSSWSPVVRERAAIAISRRKEFPVATLIKLLDAPALETRLGACSALEQFKTKAAPAVPALRQTLHADDLWLRVKAAEALAAIGQPAMPVVPELLEMIARPPAKDDPRAMEQRFLCFALFEKRSGLLGKSLDGVNRDQLRKAVAAGLRNEDGRSRSTLGNLYEKLSFQEIQPLLPAIYEATVNAAPSGEMFADGVRLDGLDLFAKNHIKEGLPLCLSLMEINRWGARNRIPNCLESLARYGSAAKPLLPQLRQLEKDLRVHPEGKNLTEHVESVAKLIKNIESASGTVELRSLK